MSLSIVAIATGGGPITMADEDVCLVCGHAPATQVVAVHMEMINHCRLTREALRTKLATEELTQQVLIPDDGAGTFFPSNLC